eukprot:7411782-Prorocentrum_lima.AAC.1
MLGTFGGRSRSNAYEMPRHQQTTARQPGNASQTQNISESCSWSAKQIPTLASPSSLNVTQ